MGYLGGVVMLPTKNGSQISGARIRCGNFNILGAILVNQGSQQEFRYRDSLYDNLYMILIF